MWAYLTPMYAPVELSIPGGQGQEFAYCWLFLGKFCQIICF